MLSPLSLLVSMPMEPDLHKDVTILKDKITSPSSPSWTSTRGPFDLILDAQPWQSYTLVIRRAPKLSLAQLKYFAIEMRSVHHTQH